jgi:16S rRNA C1402 N4-methylase RsmH
MISMLGRCFRHRASIINYAAAAPHAVRRSYHIPVLKNECIDFLMNSPTVTSSGSATPMAGDGNSNGDCDDVGDGKRRGELFLDCTLGGGGHTTEILNRGGRVIAFDQDLDAIDKVTKDLGHELKSGNLEIIHTNFANLHGQ